MKQIIYTPSAPAPIGPYSQAVKAGGMLYISGQIPIDPKTGNLQMDSIEQEAEQVMQNLRAILSEAGLSFSNVVKTTILLTSMGDFGRVNEVYGRYFELNNAPARETYQVSGLPKGVNIEISMIAVCA